MFKSKGRGKKGRPYAVNDGQYDPYGSDSQWSYDYKHPTYIGEDQHLRARLALAILTSTLDQEPFRKPFKNKIRVRNISDFI